MVFMMTIYSHKSIMIPTSHKVSVVFFLNYHVQTHYVININSKRVIICIQVFAVHEIYV